MQDGVASTPFRLRPNALASSVPGSLSASPCNGTDLQGEADQLRELNPVHIDPAVLHDQPESDRRGGVC
jgi:hypothetical protein